MPALIPNQGSPLMTLDEYDISHPYTATLISSERITPRTGPEVRHLVFQLPDDTSFDFLEGQSIAVLVPGPHEFGNKQHIRLYSIASTRRGDAAQPGAISICVRRCFYIDDVSGERYPGKASNYLCDAVPGNQIQIAGPYGAHFLMPADETRNLLMVGAGTGIAPFRAFIKHIYEEIGGWEGKVRLYYGARSGMEMLYHNDLNRDLGLFYDEGSFRAFEAVSARPFFEETSTLDRLLVEHQIEVWEMINDPKTHVYIAGLREAAGKFEKAMIAMAGSAQAWSGKRKQLIEEKRYAELLY